MHHRLLLLSLPLGHATADWFSGGLWILLPVIAADLGVSLAQIGLLITVRTLVSALSYIPGGALSDLFPRRSLFMTLTLWWVAAGYLLVSISPGLIFLISFGALAEIGAVLFHPPAMGTISQALPARRGLGLAFFNAGGSLSGIASPLIMGGLLVVLTWREVLQVTALPAIVVALVLLLLFHRLYKQFPPPLRRGFYLRQSLETLRNRTFQGVLLLMALRNMAFLVVLTFLPLYLKQELDLSATVGAFYVTLFMAAGAGASPLIGHLSDRVGRKPVLMVTFITGAAIVALTTAPPHGPLLLLVVAGSGIVISSIGAVIMATALDTIRRGLESATLGPALALQEGISAVAPLTAGAIAVAFGLESAFYFVAIILALAAVVLLPLRLARR